MSCCGNKRRALIEEYKVKTDYTEVVTYPEPNQNDKPGRVFEYIGNSSLTVFGSVSGNLYRFKSKGTRITVTYYDSFAMMGERDLRLIAMEKLNELSAMANK